VCGGVGGGVGGAISMPVGQASSRSPQQCSTGSCLPHQAVQCRQLPHIRQCSAGSCPTPGSAHLHRLREAEAVQDLGGAALRAGRPNLRHALVNLGQPRRQVAVVLPAVCRRSWCRRRGLLPAARCAVAVQVQVAQLPVFRKGEGRGASAGMGYV
jgi:hypothetical protein